MAAPTKMSDLLETYIVEREDGAISTISQCIAAGESRLLELVESLGPYLTSTDTQQRCRGTQLLADVLHCLPFSLLTEKEVNSLVLFFCDRLRDHHSITPHALKGICALANSTELTQEAATQMMRAVLKEVHVQSMSQGDRRSFYCLVATLLSTKLEAMKKIGADFVYSFVQGMDTEKDPRNLVIAFDCVTAIAQHFPLGVFAEELFEVIACYFPIDFNPPPGDPYGIKKEELVEGLRRCMVASPRFTQYCLPLILEKLSSTILSSKVDALNTLVDGAYMFGAEALKEYETSLWAGIKREVYQGLNENVVDASLKALSAVVQTVAQSSPKDGNNLHLQNYMEELLNDTQQALCNVEQPFAMPCARLLQAAAAADDAASQIILTSVLPRLLQYFHKLNQASHRKMLLGMLSGFIVVPCGKLGTSVKLKEKTMFLPLIISLLNDPNTTLRKSAIKCAKTIVELPEFLSDDEAALIGEHLISMITDPRLQDPDVRKKCSQTLSSLSATYPTVILTKGIPALQRSLEEVPMIDDLPPQSSALYSKTCIHRDVLEVLADISLQPDIVKQTIPVFTSRIKDQAAGALEAKEEILCIACCLHRIASECQDMQSLQHILTLAVVPSLGLCVQASLSDFDSVLNNAAVLHAIAKFTAVVVSKLQESSTLLNQVLQLFLDGRCQELDISWRDHLFQPFQVKNMSSSQSRLVVLFTAVVCSQKAEVEIPRLPEILDVLFQLAKHSFDTDTSVAASKGFAALLNKHNQDAALDQILCNFINDLSPELLTGGGDNQEMSRSLTFLSWVTCALVVRGHAKASELTRLLLQQLDSVVLGRQAADGFSIILGDHQDVMVSSLHANIRIMYRQRFFISVLPQLVQGIQGAQPAKKSNYLTALSYVLKNVPKQVLTTELPKLLPLLVQSLMTEDLPLQLSTMNTMSELIKDAPELLTRHIESLIPQLLKLSQYRPSMKVRIAALRCLSSMSDLPHHVLYPHQKHVLRTLATALDDHKRLVRKEAVAARGEWCLLGTAQK